MSVNHYDPVSKKLTPVAGTNNHLADDIIAPYEGGDTASKAYAIGEQFIHNNTLYTATSAISIGDTIDPGNDGNCTVSDSLVNQIKPFSGATSSTPGKQGEVPEPSAGDEDKVLQGNGGWGKKLMIDVVVQNNQYGYIGANDTFIPFKSQADIDAAVAAAMVGTATAADVKSGVTFTNSSQSGLTGTFAPQEKTVTAGTSASSVTPDSGKYLSKVTYNPTPSHSKTVTGSRTAATVTPDSGKLLSSVIVNKFPDATGTFTTTTRGTAVDMTASNNYRYVNTNGVSNTNSGTYTFTTAYTGGNVDLGETNTYRYVSPLKIFKSIAFPDNVTVTHLESWDSTQSSGTDESGHRYRTVNGTSNTKNLYLFFGINIEKATTDTFDYSSITLTGGTIQNTVRTRSGDRIANIVDTAGKTMKLYSTYVIWLIKSNGVNLKFTYNGSQNSRSWVFRING